MLITQPVCVKGLLCQTLSQVLLGMGNSQMVPQGSIIRVCIWLHITPNKRGLPH